MVGALSSREQWKELAGREGMEIGYAAAPSDRPGALPQRILMVGALSGREPQNSLNCKGIGFRIYPSSLEASHG